MALWHDIPLDAAAHALESVSLGKHRLNVLRAPAGFTIIDDCYNAGPESTRAALEILRDWPAKRRLAVLGDMRELGPDAEHEHQTLGKVIAASVETLITVGEWMAVAGKAAKEAGLARWMHVADAQEAMEAVRNIPGDGDAVLVKGSRAFELERVVEGLLG